MIDILERNLSFFRLLRNNKRIIESFDIDSQFSLVANYLNNVIVPAANNMQAEALPGINGSPNYFLSNVGDGSVIFDTLNNFIIDNTIALSKLEKAQNSRRVLVANAAAELDLASGPTNDNMVLTHKNDDVPEYNFINAVNIEDRSITYADIADGEINKEHLSDAIVNYLNGVVPTGSVTGDQLQDFSITSDKIATETINTEKKLGYIPSLLPINPPNIFGCQRQHIKNGVITPDKITDDTVGSRHFNKFKCITKNKLAPNIVNEGWLIPSSSPYVHYGPYSPSTAYNHFKNFMISPNFKITRAMLLKNFANTFFTHPLTARHFVPHVKAAFNKFGCY